MKYRVMQMVYDGHEYRTESIGEYDDYEVACSRSFEIHVETGARTWVEEVKGERKND